MRRPIGVMFLALLAVLVGLYELYMAAIYMGWVSFNIIGQEVKFPSTQWGPALWALLLALIYFWVAAGFWGVRAWAWMFGILISGWTLIWSSLLVLGNSTIEAQFVPMVLSLVVLGYLMYPGVRDAFYESESGRAIGM
jgi:hypothetical protein